MKYKYSKRRRLFCLFFGLSMCGLGVAFSTRPAIGTSPISSLPYVLTLFAPLSFGVWTVIVNILFLLG